MFHIMYISSAVVSVQESELQEMLAQYRRNNQRENITGMLLYSGENYVQLIEGLEESLQRLFAKIEKDYHHTNLIKLANGPIQERIFSNWTMGFNRVSPKDISELQGYANAKDLKFLSSLDQEQEGSAIDVLRQFAKNNIINTY